MPANDGLFGLCAVCLLREALPAESSPISPLSGGSEAKAARNILNAMANEVRAQASKHIDPAAARGLLEAIGALASAITP